MILTLNDSKDKIFISEFVPKEGKKAEIEGLNHLYSAPNFEYGYLQHGMCFYYREKPNEVSITDEHIKTFNSYDHSISGVDGFYKVENCTTKARNTLIIIRDILGIGYHGNIKLNGFFEESSKVLTTEGFITDGNFDLALQMKKLEYILGNEELAISLLKDAYFDFRLFVNLLTKVNVETRLVKSQSLIDMAYEEADENTQILRLANRFVDLEQQ